MLIPLASCLINSSALPANPYIMECYFCWSVWVQSTEICLTLTTFYPSKAPLRLICSIGSLFFNFALLFSFILIYATIPELTITLWCSTTRHFQTFVICLSLCAQSGRHDVLQIHIYWEQCLHWSSQTTSLTTFM